MNHDLKIILRKLYVFRALDDLILIYPFYSILFASHGLSALSISTLFIIWSLTDLIVNVPAGVLADKFSRKNLLAIGQLIRAAGFGLWIIMPNYWGFALGFVLWGIGGALFSGTFEAVVYDELKTFDQEKLYVKVIGRANSYALIANLVASAIAGVAILLGYNFVIAASMVTVLAAAGLAFTFPETKRFEQVADTRYFSMLKEGVLQAMRNRNILAIVLLGGFIGAVYGCMEEYVPLFLNNAGFNNSIVAPLVGVTVAAAAWASFIAHRYEHLTTKSLMILMGLSGLALAAAGVVLGVSSILLLIIYTLLIKLLETIYDGKLQHAITGGLRATVTSAAGFALELMAVTTYLAYGITSQYGGNFGAFKLIGVTVIAAALGYLIFAPRLHSRANANS